MPVVVLHSAPSSPHVGSIEFGPTRRGTGGWAGAVNVVSDGEASTIDVDMIDPYLGDLIGFFTPPGRA